MYENEQNERDSNKTTSVVLFLSLFILDFIIYFSLLILFSLNQDICFLMSLSTPLLSFSFYSRFISLFLDDQSLQWRKLNHSKLLKKLNNFYGDHLKTRTFVIENKDNLLKTE